VIGVLFGSIGSTVALAGFQQTLSMLIGLIILGAISASSQVAMNTIAGKLATKLKTRFASLLNRRTLLSRFALGMLNGLLPCGLVYVAAAVASATFSPISGSVYMAVFGLGTLPVLLLVGAFGGRVSILRRCGPRLVPVSLALVATLLVFRGLSLGIPYVSPAAGNGITSHSCH
jgi:uncharacterized protein